MRSVKLVGWMVMVLALPSCSSQKARSQLLGLWESEKKDASVEFMADGNIVLGGAADSFLDWKVMKIFRDFNMKPARNSMTFSVPDKEHIEIQGDFSSLMNKLSAGGEPGSVPKGDVVAQFHPKETLAFSISGDELTLSSQNGKSMKFRRSG